MLVHYFTHITTWLLQDLETYNKAAVSIAKKYFAIGDIDDYYKKKDAKPLIFCHFARGLSDKTYDEVRGVYIATTPLCSCLVTVYGLTCECTACTAIQLSCRPRHSCAHGWPHSVAIQQEVM
jgi:hypothetical protein